MVSDLSMYAVDPVRGFLPADDPPLTLPDRYREWETIRAEIDALLFTGRLRARIQRLPAIEPANLSNGELERAMLILAVLASAYVWAGPQPARSIPPGVAIPLTALAQRLGRQPIVSHASAVLNNWRRLDPTQPLSIDNADTLVTFLGGVDEKWFYLATVGVELAGAPAIGLVVNAQGAVAANDDAALADQLRELGTVINATTQAMLEVERWCDPTQFYRRVRPFLASWPDAGVIYEGVSAEPQHLIGGSAAQSSLIQLFDCGLDIRHDGDRTAGFLNEMRAYMPAPHRQLLQDLEKGPSVREYVAASGLPRLIEDYDGCIHQLSRLRAQHIGITGRYISRFTRAEDSERGTGGTDFVPMLRQARTETDDSGIG